MPKSFVLVEETQHKKVLLVTFGLEKLEYSHRSRKVYSGLTKLMNSFPQQKSYNFSLTEKKHEDVLLESLRTNFSRFQDCRDMHNPDKDKSTRDRLGTYPENLYDMIQNPHKKHKWEAFAQEVIPAVHKLIQDQAQYKELRDHLSHRRRALLYRSTRAADAFSPNTTEEEVSQWGDWSFGFRNFLSFMDWRYLTDLKMAEQRTAPIDSSDMDGDFFEGCTAIEEEIRKEKEIRKGKEKEKVTKGKGYGGYGRGRGGKGKGKKGRGRGGKGKKGYGKNARQVENKGYGGKGKGDGKGKGVTCYDCGKTGHIASECWSRPNDSKGKGKKGKIRNVREDEESDSWNESNQHDHPQGQQRGSHDAGNVRRAGDVRGNERVRRIETGSMPIIEKVEDDEDFIDLGALFAGFSEGDALRMVKMIPVCDMSMGGKEEYEKDELHWWYESTRSQQEWMERRAETLLDSPVIEDMIENKVRMVNLWDDSLTEVVLDSGADTHVLPLSYYSEELGTSAYPKLKLVIRDAQGNAIHTTEQKMNITFEFRKENGKKICIMDSAVFGNVTTTLLTTYEEEEVKWSELEFFECGEEWSGRERIEITASKRWNVVVTIMEREPCGMEAYGKYVNPFTTGIEEEKNTKRKSDEEKDRDELMKELDAMESGEKIPDDDERNTYEEKEEKRKQVEEKLPSIGESMEEKMNVGGIELTPESTLREMRKACEILRVGKTGSKAQVWKRMKEAVATSKLKELVEISKKIDEEFSRKPEGEKRPEPPSEEERKLHELTHLPKADWCESCTATRSREDNFEVSEKKHEASLVSMDFKFTGTRDEDNAKDPKDTLAISLVMVDQETKFVHMIPVPTKEATSYLVEEVCRVLMLLNSKVILRTDTEPAMISLRRKVQGIRKLKKLETEVQDVAPDAHEGMQAERWVQTVRNLSKTLVCHAETEAKVKITSASECTLYPWAGKGLKIKVEGPMDEREGSMSFLKRGFQATEDGNVEMTINPKYIEGLVEVLGLEKAYTKKIPCPADNGRAFQAQKNGMEPLTPELHHVCRKGERKEKEREDLMKEMAKVTKDQDAEKRKDELRKRLTEQLQQQEVDPQESAKRRRRNLAKEAVEAVKAKASKPSESSSSEETEKEEEKKEEPKESGERPEEPAEQAEEPKEGEKPEEAEKAKEPEKEVVQTPDEAKEDEKLEEEKGEEEEEVDPADMHMMNMCGKVSVKLKKYKRHQKTKQLKKDRAGGIEDEMLKEIMSHMSTRVPQILPSKECKGLQLLVKEGSKRTRLENVRERRVKTAKATGQSFTER
ncbi:unnamed protein product [Symbiodinium microadriaticum]|nr:unnamed protein product [Symbiodinium microadriaticum]